MCVYIYIYIYIYINEMTLAHACGSKGHLSFCCCFFGLGHVIKLLPAYWLNHTDFNWAEKLFFYIYFILHFNIIVKQNCFTAFFSFFVF